MKKKAKIISCRKCNAPMEKGLKICPSCGAKQKKPIYKRIWFILLVLILLIGVFHSISSTNSKSKEEKIGSTIILKEKATEAEKEDETDSVTATETKEEQTASKQEKTETKEEKSTEKSSDDSDLVDGMHPEFKEAMDSYETFMNDYCDFMKKYAESDGKDAEMLADYADYMSKYADFVKKFDAWDEDEMNDTELAYYLDVQTRVSKKLAELSQ